MTLRRPTRGHVLVVRRAPKLVHAQVAVVLGVEDVEQAAGRVVGCEGHRQQPALAGVEPDLALQVEEGPGARTPSLTSWIWPSCSTTKVLEASPRGDATKTGSRSRRRLGRGQGHRTVGVGYRRVRARMEGVRLRRAGQRECAQRQRRRRSCESRRRVPHGAGRTAASLGGWPLGRLEAVDGPATAVVLAGGRGDAALGARLTRSGGRRSDRASGSAIPAPPGPRAASRRGAPGAVVAVKVAARQAGTGDRGDVATRHRAARVVLAAVGVLEDGNTSFEGS